MKQLLLSTALALTATLAIAEGLPQPLTPYVSDFANILPDDAEAALTDQLKALRRDNDIEFAVVLMDSRTPYGPDATDEAFATRLFNTWGIGDATRNDGILFLVLKNDRFTRIELGKSYGSDWDGTAARILDRNVLPYFKEDNFTRGISEGSKEIIDTIALPHQAGEAPKNSPFAWLIPGAFVAIFGLFAGRRHIKDRATAWSRCPNCGQRSLSVSRNRLEESTQTTTGRGERRIRCANCDYDNAEFYTIPMRSSSSGGSFGGGSSGGGGASGRW